uniref:Uncharacterized protein n=1 Tax=Plectus sambesii TaxID=2011161 RepID=A0A914WX25_9BILA
MDTLTAFLQKEYVMETKIVDIANLIAYIVIFCFGMPSNIYVIYRLRKLAKENREKYENGAGLGLFVMSTSDLISLLAISLWQNIPLVETAPDVVNSAACKVRNMLL